MQRIGIVGFGFMGAAIARGLLERNRDLRIALIDKDPVKREMATTEMGIRDYSDQPEEFCRFAELIVLAVKPQDLSMVGSLLRPYAAGARVLSILAGVSMAAVAEELGTTHVARAMPNLAAQIGSAVVGLSLPGDSDQDLAHGARQVCSALGATIEVREELLHAVTGVSGSGIAYVFAFIHYLAMGAVREGLPYPQALEAAREVVGSAAALLRDQPITPMEMVTRVCSPAGTTIEGMRALENAGFGAAVMEAVSAASRRSREL